jgi:pimeloyl-ACP methyl ester carboxylesterase
LLSAIGWGIGLYASLVALVWLGQRSLLYPVPGPSPAPEIEGAVLERISGAERTVYALHVPAPAGAPTLVHFHGNAEDLGDQVALGQLFRARGLGFYAVEYPGYGLARDNAPSEAAIYSDAEIALGRLRELGVPREETILCGISLGSGVAAEMALRGHGARLVLIAPYTSIAELGRRLLPLLPVDWLVRDRFETARKAKQLDLPALIVHGSDDEVIPSEMGRRLSELLPRAELLLVPGGKHNDLFSLHGERVVEKIARFSLAR